MDTASAIPAGFRGPAARLTQGDVDRAAQELGITSRLIEAIASVEARNMGFLPDGRPQLLYEAHVFHKLTGGRFDASAPNISTPIWNPSIYGAEGAHQYDRLAQAMELDRLAGLQSATWGMFQLLGSNYKSLHYDSIDEFVAAMCESEGRHLDGFVAYCQANNLVTDLQTQQWLKFAEGYNGPGAPNLYASRLIAAFNSGKFPPRPTSLPPALPPPVLPAPPPPAAAIPVRLRRGMEMVIPGVRGLTQDGQPYALTDAIFKSDDVAVATASVSGEAEAGQTIEISAKSSSGATDISCGGVLTFQVTVEEPLLDRIVVDMTKAVLRPLPMAAGAMMALMLAVAPAGEHEPVNLPPAAAASQSAVSERERLCLNDPSQPAFAVERCLRWVHAFRR